VNATAGAVLEAAIESAAECASSRCHGHGACVDLPAPGCVCSKGFAGANCSSSGTGRSGAALRTDDERTITVNPQQQLRVWDGIGGLSAGASSRLLYDYPPQIQRCEMFSFPLFIQKAIDLPRQALDKHRKSSKQRCAFRSDILDMLFTPQLGWAYQILKIETGGDCQSTWYGNASFRAPFYSYENPSICQDRLGTSIGEVEKRDACFAGGLRARSPTRRRTLVQKSPFGAILYFEK
jgi:hypothetical protein